MKVPLALGTVLIGFTASAAPLPSFPAAKLELPPLSLLESARNALPKPFEYHPAISASRRGSTMDRAHFISRMPVLRPKSDVIPKLRVKEPDATIDYKMPMKSPEVTSVE